MFNKTEHNTKKHFCRYYLQCFSSKSVLIEHRKICLEINGKQSVTVESGAIKSKNYFKQIAVPFKIYADFESFVKGLQVNDRDRNTSYTGKHQDHISCNFAYKLVCIDDNFSKPFVLYRGKNAVNKFIEAILEEYEKTF